MSCGPSLPSMEPSPVNGCGNRTSKLHNDNDDELHSSSALNLNDSDGESDDDTHSAATEPVCLARAGADHDQTLLQEIVRIIAARYDGLPNGEADDSDTTFILQGQGSYQQLLAALDAHTPPLLSYVQDKVRYEWDAGTGILTLLPRRVEGHQYLLEGLRHALDAGLDELKSWARGYPRFSPLVEGIDSGRQATIEEENGTGQVILRMEPDEQLEHIDQDIPVFVFKVTSYRTEDDIEDKCGEFMEEFPDLIRGALALRIDQNKDKNPNFLHTAKLTLYSAHIEKTTLHRFRLVHDQVFYKEGEVLPGSIEIPLRLLLPSSPAHQLPRRWANKNLVLKFEDLCKYMDELQLDEAREHSRVATKMKTVTHVVYLDPNGRVILRKRLPRKRKR